MRVVGWLAVILALGVGIWYWNDRQVREQDATIRVLMVELDSMKAIVKQDSLELAAAHRKLDSLRNTVRDTVRKLKNAAEADRVESAKQYAELRETLTENQQLMLDNLQASWQRQLAARDEIISLQETLLREQAEVLVQDSVAIANLRKTLHETEQLARYWEKKANPSFFEDLGAHLPQYGTAVLIGGGAILLASLF